MCPPTSRCGSCRAPPCGFARCGLARAICAREADEVQSPIHAAGVFTSRGIARFRYWRVRGHWSLCAEVGDQRYAFTLRVPGSRALALDAKPACGPGFGFNFSCEPNARLMRYRDKFGRPVVVVETLVRLFDGEEVTIQKHDVGVRGTKGTCSCGSSQCTRQLGVPNTYLRVALFEDKVSPAERWRELLADKGASAPALVVPGGKTLAVADAQSLLDNACGSLPTRAVQRGCASPPGSHCPSMWCLRRSASWRSRWRAAVTSTNCRASCSLAGCSSARALSSPAEW